MLVSLNKSRAEVGDFVKIKSVDFLNVRYRRADSISAKNTVVKVVRVTTSDEQYRHLSEVVMLDGMHQFLRPIDYEVLLEIP